MNASKITHRNEIRIRVDFPYNKEIVDRLRQIPDAKWSKTMRSWHIPYTIEAFKQLKELFPDVDFDSKSAALVSTASIKQVPKPSVKPTEKTLQKTDSKLQPVIKSEKDNPVISFKPKSAIEIVITRTQIQIILPKNEVDIEYIRSFRYAKWDSSKYCWIIPNRLKNADKIKSYFSNRNPKISEFIAQQEVNVERPSFTKNEMLVINFSNRKLKVYFSFNKEIAQQVKRIPYSTWNGYEFCWEVSSSDRFMTELKQIAQQNGLEFRHHLVSKNGIKPRKSRYDILNYRECPQAYYEKLYELRYSKHTIDSYTDLFEEFINYYENTPIEDITEIMIIDFLQYLVTVRCVSSSYQNQSINAIKFYYERVMGGSRKMYYIERPREEKFLPEVLSEEEVIAIINATENLKHKAILITIYSAGLRISELINLKIKDIDSQRMQIRVEQAKGKKDRYTVLGNTTLEILRKYVSQYKPAYWLFEGSSSRQYSVSSVKKTLKTSLEKTGIKKHVTVHTLRHSFATHLLEAGTDIRYIQSLLGHENTKTTEIYTHITTKGFDQIKSPLDKLKIK